MTAQATSTDTITGIHHASRMLPSMARFREEADRAFFERVEQGYQAIAAANPRRVRSIDATAPAAAVAEEIWAALAPLLRKFQKRDQAAK